MLGAPPEVDGGGGIYGANIFPRAPGEVCMAGPIPGVTIRVLDKLLESAGRFITQGKRVEGLVMPGFTGSGVEPEPGAGGNPGSGETIGGVLMAPGISGSRKSVVL